MTLPEELATDEVDPFVDWQCRALYEYSQQLGNPSSFCSDQDYKVHHVCKETYPEINTTACMEREREEQEAARLASTLRAALPCAVVGLLLAVGIAVFMHTRYRRYLYKKQITIDFSELDCAQTNSVTASGTSGSNRRNLTFYVVGQKSSSSMMFAKLRGTKVLQAPCPSLRVQLWPCRRVRLQRP